MTLPTVQPFDYQDWGTPDAFTYQEWSEPIVTAPMQALAEFEMARYPNAVLTLSGDGDGSDWAVHLQWMSAGTSEGGSLVYQETVVRQWQVPVVIPITALTPTLLLRDADATAYPHSVLGTMSQFATTGKMSGWPGGIRVFDEAAVIGATTNATILPRGCAPGLHELRIHTAALTWEVIYQQFIDANTMASWRLMNNATAAPTVCQFIAPASAWNLLLRNTSAGATLFNTSINRIP